MTPQDQARRMAEEVELPISEAITHVIADGKDGKVPCNGCSEA